MVLSPWQPYIWHRHHGNLALVILLFEKTKANIAFHYVFIDKINYSLIQLVLSILLQGNN